MERRLHYALFSCLLLMIFLSVFILTRIIQEGSIAYPANIIFYALASPLTLWLFYGNPKLRWEDGRLRMRD